MITGGDEAVFISARTGEGVERLADAVKRALFADMIKAEMLIPYDKGGIVSYLCENGQIDGMDYREEGTLLRGSFKEADYNRYKQYSL